MEERLLKFVKLVDAGSYTKAARVMYISQPALTMAIKQLEKELGKTLLIRHGRQFRPTTAGKEAYIAGRKIQASKERLITNINATSKHKMLSIGLIDSMAKHLFADPDATSDLLTYTNLSLSVNNTDKLIGDLQNNRLQYVIGTKSKEYDGRLVRAYKLADEPLVCVTASHNMHETNQDLEKQKVISDFVTYNPESNTCKLINDTMRKIGVTTKISVQSTSPEVMKDLVVMGRGTAYLPRSNVQPLIARGMIGIVGGKEMKISRPIWCYKSVFSEPPAVVGKIEEYLRGLLD